MCRVAAAVPDSCGTETGAVSRLSEPLQDAARIRHQTPLAEPHHGHGLVRALWFRGCFESLSVASRCRAVESCRQDGQLVCSG